VSFVVVQNARCMAWPTLLKYAMMQVHRNVCVNTIGRDNNRPNNTSTGNFQSRISESLLTRIVKHICHAWFMHGDGGMDGSTQARLQTPLYAQSVVKILGLGTKISSERGIF
jgi:hypothetical protein